jgi:hypothetical protein
MLSTGRGGSWQYSCTVQMPAAHAELHSQQDATRGSAARKAPTFYSGQPAPTTPLAGCQSAGCCSGPCNTRRTTHRADVKRGHRGACVCVRQ